MKHKPPLLAMREEFVRVTPEDRVIGIVTASTGQLSLIAQKTRGRHEHPEAVWGMVDARPVLKFSCEGRGPQLVAIDLVIDGNMVDTRALADCMVIMARRWGNILYENLDERVEEAYQMLIEADRG